MVIVNYGAGNLTSVQNALNYLGIKSEISAEPSKIENAEKIIFPGVGAAAAAMENLNKSGIGEALKQAFKKNTPILGICIGCQIILESSEEDGGTQCLGLLQGQAVRFKNEAGLKIPHIGWNQVNFELEHPIFKGIFNNSNFYFVHSYHPNVCRGASRSVACNAPTAPTAPTNVYGTTTYGSQTFPCIIGKDNLIATQFHLEKSGDIGLQVLKNFYSCY